MDVKLFVRIVKKSFTAYQNLIFTYKFAKKERIGEARENVGKLIYKEEARKNEMKGERRNGN